MSGIQYWQMKRESKKMLVICAAVFFFCCVTLIHGQSLTTLEYRVNGTGLQVTPAAVPKRIAGGSFNSVASQELSSGSHVEPILEAGCHPAAILAEYYQVFKIGRTRGA